MKGNDNNEASDTNWDATGDDTEEEEQWCGAPECDQR